MKSISVCVPHWQVLGYIQPCLRSIRKYSPGIDLEILVVDNGSRDESLDWLRSLSWIRLIERPTETHENWPENVFTAWDAGLAEARGDYYITMHSDVFIKRTGWLEPLVREMERDSQIAASGTWKLEIENPLYAAQKRFFGLARAGVKRLAGKRPPVTLRQGHYPRDFCAMYRREVLLEHGLTFRCIFGNRGGGYAIARQLWERDYHMGMVPVREMATYIEHIAHGTAAVRQEKRLSVSRDQRKAEAKVAGVFADPTIQELVHDSRWDAAVRPAA